MACDKNPKWDISFSELFFGPLDQLLKSWNPLPADDIPVLSRVLTSVMEADSRMLEEPDLFISLNTGGGCSSVGSVSPGMNTIKRGDVVTSLGVTPSGTLRHHTCPGPGVQLHDIQCIPYTGGGYGPDLR